jgi:hypothetical protein
LTQLDVHRRLPSFVDLAPSPRQRVQDLVDEADGLGPLADAAPAELRGDLITERDLVRTAYQMVLDQWGDDGTDLSARAHDAGYFDPFTYVWRYGIGDGNGPRTATRDNYDYLRASNGQKAAAACGALQPLNVNRLDQTPPGRIAFKDIDTGSLASTNSAGTDRQPVQTIDQATSPSGLIISPDQQHLADTVQLDQNTVLVVANPDGSNPRTVDTGSKPSCPAWSLDSTHFILGGGAFAEQLRIVGLDGTATPIPVETDNYACAAFLTPTSIIYQRRNPDSHLEDLWTANTDGTNQHLLVAIPDCTASTFAVSPNGHTIAIAAGCTDFANWGLYETNTDGTNLHRVIPGIAGTFSWSPDSSYLAFEYVDPNGDRRQPRLLIATADGTAASPLTGPAAGFPAWYSSPTPTT